jgi:hypothetical protein
MIGTLAWKELREHQTVWIAMASLAIFLVVILTPVLAPNGVAAAPDGKLHTIALAALILAGTYGLICGAMMVAGEQEARTQTFLDTLPASRFRLWVTKLFMGGLFTLAHALVVTGTLVALGLTEVSSLPAGWQVALPLVALEAFGYGLFGSVMARSVLAAVGWALVPMSISWIIGGEVWWPPPVVILAVRSIFLLSLLVLSGLIFCRPDLQRGAGASEDLPTPIAVSRRHGWGPEEDFSPRPRRRPAGEFSSSEIWRVLVWLALRQGWPRFLLFVAAGFVTGLLVPNAALTIWPVATLLVGVAFGTGMFSGEQAGESYRFLGNQRLPAGRVWLGKATAWSGMAAGVIVAMLLGAMAHLAEMPRGSGGRFPGGENVLGSRLLLEYLPKDVFLLLWPVYGFGIGQFISLVCRKSAVAVVLSMLVSVPLVGIWIPSLVGGGLKLWQVLPVAALLLLSTRLGLWAWAGDLLKNWRPVLGLSACVGMAGLWVAGNLVYRAVEVPDLGQPFDVAAFLGSLPTLEQNKAGILVRRAAHELVEQERLVQERFERIEQALAPKPAEVLPGTALPEPAESQYPSLGELVAQIVERGWPDGDAELASWWLDQMSQSEWIQHLREAAALPLGVVEDPRQSSASIQIEAYQRAAQLLTARALQIQARGEHGAALDHLLWALALSRNLRHQTVAAFYQMGQTVEATALHGLDRWLDRLGAQPDLLRRALDELNRHEEESPPATDPIKAEYLTLRERLDDPARWFYIVASSSATAELERDLIGLALQTPWERERATRVLHTLTSSRLKEAQTPYWQLPLQARLGNRSSGPADEAYLASLFIPDGTNPSFNSGQWQRLLADSRLLLQLFMLSSRPQHVNEAFSQCRVRAARLKLALALYQAHEGKPALSLAHLVPRYLEELPLDPFSGGAFQYRVSMGQRIEWRQEGGGDHSAWTDIPAGQGVLWSVGPEASGLGMRSTPFQDPRLKDTTPGGGLIAPDQVFIVPSWQR